MNNAIYLTIHSRLGCAWVLLVLLVAGCHSPENIPNPVTTSNSSSEAEYPSPEIVSFSIITPSPTSSHIVEVSVEAEDHSGMGIGYWLINENPEPPDPLDFYETSEPSQTIVLENGERSLYAWVLDGSGGISEAFPAQKILLDTKPPEITEFVTQDTGKIAYTTIEFTLDGTDGNGTGIDKWLVRESSETPSFEDFTSDVKPEQVEISNSQGDIALYAWAVDKVGNISMPMDPIYVTHDSAGPENISNLTANGLNGKIVLQWTYPNDSDTLGVRIVRKATDDISGPDDGELVCDPCVSRVVDEGLTNYDTYYYAAFAYDNANPRNYAETQASVSTMPKYPISCKEIYDTLPSEPSGTYTLDPDGESGLAPFPALCDMDNVGGGWTLVLVKNDEASVISPDVLFTHSYTPEDYDTPSIPDTTNHVYKPYDYVVGKEARVDLVTTILDDAIELPVEDTMQNIFNNECYTDLVAHNVRKKKNGSYYYLHVCSSWDEGAPWYDGESIIFGWTDEASCTGDMCIKHTSLGGITYGSVDAMFVFLDDNNYHRNALDIQVWIR